MNKFNLKPEEKEIERKWLSTLWRRGQIGPVAYVNRYIKIELNLD